MCRPNEILVRVHATTVTRGELTWAETYYTELPLLGHDLAGTVVKVPSGDTKVDGDKRFKPGDEVYGMFGFSKGSTWAELSTARVDQLAIKPRSLSWTESAAVPLSALTAWQALFEKAGVTEPDFASLAEAGSQGKFPAHGSKKILVTGANGAVGTFLVQLAALAGLEVTGLTKSKQRDETFLKSLGAHKVLEYDELWTAGTTYDIIIDTVGGKILDNCWSVVGEEGLIISVESSSVDFVRRHREERFHEGKEGVHTLFFIVATSGKQLEKITAAFDLGLLKVFVAQEFLLQEAKLAYDVANGRLPGRGKVVISVAC